MPTGGRILGLDYGTRRIGVAVSDPLKIIATGVTTLENSPRLIDELRAIVRRYEPVRIVLGLPINLKGERGQKAIEAEAFARTLEEQLHLEVVLVDERFTSQQAHETLRTMGVGRQKRRSKETIDRMAAALILQSYLDAGGAVSRDEGRKVGP